MPRWPFGGRWQSVKWGWSAFSLVPIPLPANWHSSSLLVIFSLHRTGLEAIMETYAFWRPPVRTLTFEDFTTMQKQQGECTKSCGKSRRRGWKSSNVLCRASGGVTYLVELLTAVKGHSREGGWKWWTGRALRGAIEPLHLPGIPSAPKS